MVDIARVVWTTSFDASSQAVSLPRPLMIACAGFYRIHRIWRWYRKTQIYSNPNNFVALASGHALNYVAGDRLLVRISALSVLIANRIMLVADQIFRLQDSVRKLQDSFRGEYSKVIKYELVKGAKWSPSTLSEVRYRYRKCIEKIKRIFVSMFRLLKETFVLSMRMVDAIEMFYMNPDTRDEGVNELFVNGSELLDTLEENQNELQKSLKKMKPIIDEILTGIGSQLSADEFIELSSEALGNAADASQAVQQITNPVGIVVQEVGKRTLYGFASILGLEKLIPKKLHPNYTVTPREIDPVFHFAPDSSIQIKNY